jgi:aryl-alcohol dehydrogenase-like predicted oxidoreductase
MEERQHMLYRPLGSTGEMVSAVGVGGFHLGESIDEALAMRIVRAALDEGITFLDNSWDYNDGRSEERMGKALRDGYRERAFLMTKVDGRTRSAAAEQLDESLRRLQTDRIDLVQVHEVIRRDDAERVFAEGGALEALQQARAAGKVRYVGFTGHKDPDVHLHMLDVAAAHDFRFDAVQLPLNVMDAHFRSFERLVLPRLVAEGAAVLGMKSLASGAILETGAVTAMECLQYALDLPTSVVITGLESMDDLEQALEAVRTFAPLEPDVRRELLQRTAHLAGEGASEPYKTTLVHDATTEHPEWLGVT